MADPLMFFSRIVIAVMTIPIIAAIVNWKKLDKSLKVFFVFCLVTFLISLGETIFIWHARSHKEFWGPILEWWGIENTHFIQILAFLRDYLILGYFFKLILKPRPIANWVWVIALLLALTTTINYLFIEGYKNPGVFNPAADAIFCFSIPMVSLWYLYHSDTRIEIYKNPVFWISLGLILPNLMSLFLYFTSDYLQKNNYPLYVNLMLVKNFFEIIGIILLTIGFSHAYYMRFFYPTATK